MPTTKTITLYKYDELSDDAKEHAREIMQDINLDSSDEDTCEFWQDEKLPALGFDSAKISYSGFSSQGDGASFKCDVNLLKFLQVNKLCGKYRKLYNAIKKNESWYEMVITQSGRYYHEFSMSISSNHEFDNETLENQFDEIEKIVLTEARKTAKKIYKELESEYDFATSKEAIEETIIINEYDFDVEGNRPAKIY